MLISRRRFVEGAGSLILLNGCDLAPSTPEKAQQPLPTIRSAESIAKESRNATPGPEISTEHAKRLIDALMTSGISLWKMIGEHLNVVLNSPNKPREFPYWFSDISFPIKVNVDEESRSILEYGGEPKTAPEAAFVVDYTNGQRKTHQEINFETVKRIRLGIPPHLKVEGPLPEALYLAKEFVSLLVHMRIAFEGYDTLHPEFLTIKDRFDQAVTDREKQVLYGASLVHDQITSTGSPVWRIADSLPVLILSEGVLDAVKSGKLPKSSSTLGNFVHARNMLTDRKDVADIITQINGQWVRAGTVLPPEGITLKSLKGPLFLALTDLHKIMYGK